MQNALHVRAWSMWKPAERTAHLFSSALLTVLYSCHHCYLEMLLSEVSGAPYEGRLQQSTFGGISQTLIHLLEVLYSLSFWPDMIYIYATPRPHYPRERDLVTIVQEAGWAPVSVWTGAENLAYPGIRFPNRPARSESLCRLSHHSPRSLIQILLYFWLTYLKVGIAR